jgi:hypothetical protein
MLKLFDLARRRDRGVSYCDSCSAACDSKCRSEAVRDHDRMRAIRWTPTRIV